MQRITHERIQTLARKNTFPSVSMYVPFENDYYDLRDTLIEMARRARQELQEVMTYEDARQFVAPLYHAIHDRDAWEHEAFDNSAALFLDSEGLTTVALPEEEQESVVVDRGFHVTQLFEQLTNNGRFYTLLLTTKAAHLVQSDVQGAKTVAKVYARNERSTQDHGKNYHSRKFDPKATVSKRYLNRVDRQVRKAIKDQTAPLILVGLNKIQAAYRSSNTYDLLMPEGIQLNPDSLRLDDLLSRVQPIAGRFYKQYEEEAQKELFQRQATDEAHVVSGVRRVLEMLKTGKVRTLFIDPHSPIWGAPLTKAIHTQRKIGDIDLTNMALREALDHKTEVFKLPIGSRQNGAIAILR